MSLQVDVRIPPTFTGYVLNIFVSYHRQDQSC
jgi:hypothetical protein